MEYPSWIGALLLRLEEAGEEGYLVGGCLRDSLLGIPPHDFDIAVSCPPERTTELFSDYRVIPTGIRHGTVTVIAEGEPVELTTFRVDGTYTDSRHPDRVCFAGRIEEDLSRRDFTVNAMAYNPRRGLVDLFGGAEDLASRTIRAVGDAYTRFTEDALRILRAFRFSAQLGFSVHHDTLKGAYEARDGLARIAKERIAAEWLRLLSSPAPTEPLRQMIALEILPYIAGNYTPSDRTVADLAKTEPDSDLRVGLFLSEATEEEARSILRQLKCSNRCITGALAVRRGAQLSVDTPKDAGRFRAATGVYALSAVKASIRTGNSPEEALAWITQSTAPCRVADLAISGRELGEMGLCGKELGQMLSLLLEKAMEDPSLNQRDTLLALVRDLQKKKEKGTDYDL